MGPLARRDRAHGRSLRSNPRKLAGSGTHVAYNVSPCLYSPGDRIGHYQITGLLGAGGMGEVYRAQDSQLGRSVAIKVLPPALAADATYLARSQREAQVLASLTIRTSQQSTVWSKGPS